MTDERTCALIAAVGSLCEGGGFKILEERELTRLFPASAEELARLMDFLAAQRLIELRYADGGTYCVRVLPAGRMFAEREAQKLRDERETRRAVFGAAALGGALGGVIAALLVLVVTLF